MAHETQTAEPRWSFAFWHIIRVKAGIVRSTYGAAHYGLTQAEWEACQAQVDDYIRKAAARILTGA